MFCYDYRVQNRALTQSARNARSKVELHATWSYKERWDFSTSEANQRRRIVRKDGGARSNMAGIICPPWSD